MAKWNRQSLLATSVATIAGLGLLGTLATGAFAATNSGTTIGSVVSSLNSGQSSTTQPGAGGFGGFGHHHGGPGFAGAHGRSAMMTQLATLLNISPTTLKADLQAKETIAAIAQKQGVAVSTLTTGLENTLKTNLDKAVAAGKLTATKEQSILSNAGTRITNMINGVLPTPGAHGLPFPGGPGAGFRGMGPMKGNAKSMMTQVATLLNISPTTLKADLQAKETIATIAQKQGVSVSTLTTGLENALKANLDKAVAAGKLTATQEQQILSHASTHITDMINGVRPTPPTTPPSSTPTA